jgi:hypothetical protein
MFCLIRGVHDVSMGESEIVSLEVHHCEDVITLQNQTLTMLARSTSKQLCSFYICKDGAIS